ncbi:YlxR domain-containing protein [Hyphomicrobiales bacterium]|nr:YlxR domain-containing protein [Hyphomicrobiales bacterium]CAH1680825.1 YlxR domain-containing protein [Hyphomicrobiales bacterium]
MSRRRDATVDLRREERLCAVTREVKDPDELIRFVAGPDGTMVPDLRRRLPGRGVWVTGTASAVRQAVKRRAFGRSLKQDVVTSPALADEVAALLRRDTLQALALANKAGAVVTGFGKVEEAAEKGNVAALLHASEAAPDGRRKLAQAMRRGFPETSSAVAVVDVFAEGDLDLALGRAHVIHAALIAGPGSEVFMARWRRLARYVADDEPRAGPSDGTLDELGTGPQGPVVDEREGAGFERNE